MASENPTLQQRVQARLERLEADGLKRSLEEAAGIDLCSNDYLAFSSHPLIRLRFARAAEALGAGSTGSRLLRGHRAAFRAVEERFACLKGTPAALFFGSGWAANLGVLTSFPDEGDVVFSDALNHASLIDGIRLSAARRVVFPHCDADALERLLATEPCAGQRFLVTESLFSMDGDVAPLRRYADLQARYDLALIVDEAHAVGLYGANGSGLIEESGCGRNVFLSVNSAGKALGVSGAFVCGPDWAIDCLIQSARPFVYSTAPPPAVAEAVDESLELLSQSADLRAHVRRLGAAVRENLGMPAGDSPIVPVLLGDSATATAVAGQLQRAGFDARAIRPPTVPEGTARLRVSLNAALSAEDVKRFCDELRAILKERQACTASS